MGYSHADNDHFEIIAPAQWSLPVVLNSPHSGSQLPPDLLQLTRLSVDALRRSEDKYVDELFEPCVDFGAPLLRAKVSRAYVDLNREPYELDPRMFIEPLPHHMNAASPRVVSGLGTIPRIVGDGEHIYHGKLPLESALQRIENIYRPYHRTLAALLNHVYAETGFVCLIDCHSMPPSAVLGGHAVKNVKGQVDVVLGDRYGAACSRELVEQWREGFAAAGLQVKLNHPYPGGFITENHGRPRAGRHALQIELNRALYLQESNGQRAANFTALQSVIKTVFESFMASLPVSETRAAAE